MKLLTYDTLSAGIVAGFGACVASVAASFAGNENIAQNGIFAAAILAAVSFALACAQVVTGKTVSDHQRGYSKLMWSMLLLLPTFAAFITYNIQLR